MKRVTVDVAEPLHRRLRVQAAMTGKTMSDIIRELLERELPETTEREA